MKVSIIVATHQRPASLGILLAALAAQCDPARHEVIVAENGTPRPAPLAAAPTLRHLHDPVAGKCRIQNRALALARGELVAFLDDDLTVAPDYLRNLERFFDSWPGFAALKGRVLPAHDPTAIVGDKAAYLDLPTVDHGERVCAVRGVLGASMAFRREIFARVGGFDERLGPGACGAEEETEFSHRLRGCGLLIGYAPDVVAFHEVDAARADRSRFLARARRIGRCRMLHERHRLPALLAALALHGSRAQIARLLGLGPARVAREERRFGVSVGMLQGWRGYRPEAHGEPNSWY